MLNILVQLLGKDASIFRRYITITVIYGVLCGLTITALVPVLQNLFMGNTHKALYWLVALLTGVAVSWWLRCRVERGGVRVGVAILRGARHQLGDHIASLPIGWFTPRNTARLSHVVTQGVMTIAQLPAHVFTPLIVGVLIPFVLVAALLFVHWPLAVIALGALPLLGGFLALTTRLSLYADAAFQRDFAQTSQRVVEFAQAQSVLRAFNGDSGSTGFFDQAVGQQYQSGKALIRLSALSSILNAWAVQVVFAALLLMATLWINDYLDGALMMEEITSVIVSLLLISRFIDSLIEVVGYSEVLRGAKSQLDSIAALLAVPPLPESSTPLVSSDASVELHDVTFRYTSDGPDVLRGVTLSIKPGSMVAIIGESGSGKTTLARLIARFHDTDQGCIRVGGADVRHISTTDLAQDISQIFQDNYLFAGSIADNIRVGKPDASDAEIMGVAERAGVIEILKRLPQGVDTAVGEGGARLSGGERQRIAIARALIKEAPILIVDEATAALDAENQAIIANTLLQLRGRCTLIVIAHQLSTIVMADQVVVLDKGQIIEHGSPQQLKNIQGFYAQFLAQRRAVKGWRIVPTDVSNKVDF